MKRPRFVLLDRDGTINIDRHYLSDPDDLELLPGAAEGLRRIRALGYGLIVVTNQSGVGRGFFDERQLERIHVRLRELLADAGVVLDGIYCCPHVPEAGCRCRKPEPGLVRQAVQDFGFDPAESVVIGDKPSDLELADAIGARSILVRTGYGLRTEREGGRADAIVDDLATAATLLQAEVRRTEAIRVQTQRDGSYAYEPAA